MQPGLIRKFIETVQTIGSQTAVVDHPDGRPVRRTSYDELFQRACQIASHVRQRGIAPQSFVTIEMPMSMEFLATQMGVWMARCVVVPMGVTFPEERKHFIRQHCDSAFHINAEEYQKAISLQPSEYRIQDLPDEEDSALLIYTSGSTGNPKGILHDHRSVSEVVSRMCACSDCQENERGAAFAPPYFIAALCFWKMVRPSEVYIIPPKVAMDVTLLAEYHREYGIHVSYVSATVYPLYRCLSPTIRAISTGSDRVVCRRMPTSYTLFNSYGLTETAGMVIEGAVTEPTDNAPIGRPLKGVELAILDDDMNPVPQGQEGEICLKGHFCKGYFKDEEKTRALYRGGWLHTGDLGYQLPDGRIQFVNRKDWMVKVNGQRVEPGEVEAAMRTIGGIAQAVVKGFDGGNGTQYLVGYYTLRSKGVNLTPDQVRTELEQRLPSYMVPSFFVPMETFPLNASGKIDRKSLEAPQREDLTADYVAPTNEVEVALCEIMANVLRLPRVGIDDHFLHLGGDSIRMMQMQQLCADSEIELLHNTTTAMIYQGATPREIAKRLSIVTRREKPQMDDFPLSEIQKVYFYSALKREGELDFNVAFLSQLDEHIDLARLAEAITKAIAGHKGLFTRFFLDANQQPRQKIVMEPLTIPIEQMTVVAFEAEKPKLIQPFRILQERLFRVRLFDVNGAHYLFWDTHHSIIDGMSYRILFREIDCLYRGLSVEPEDWTTAELALEEAEMLQTEFATKAIQWHKDNFPADSLFLKKEFTKRDKSVIVPCPLAIGYDEVERFCLRAGVTVNTFTTAAYLLLLGRYAGRNDMSLFSSFNARSDKRSRNTVGLFARPIMVRAKWTDTMPVNEYLRSVGTMLLDSMTYSAVGLGALYHTLKVFPVFLFIYQGEIKGNIFIDGYRLRDIPIPQGFVSGLAAHLGTKVEDNIMTLELNRCESWRDDAYLRRMAEHYTECLRALMRAQTIGEVLNEITISQPF